MVPEDCQKLTKLKPAETFNTENKCISISPSSQGKKKLINKIKGQVTDKQYLSVKRHQCTVSTELTYDDHCFFPSLNIYQGTFMCKSLLFQVKRNFRKQKTRSIPVTKFCVSVSEFYTFQKFRTIQHLSSTYQEARRTKRLSGKSEASFCKERL